MSGGALADFRRLMDSPATVIVPSVPELQDGQRRRLEQLQQEVQRKRTKFVALVEADLDPIRHTQRSRKLLSRLK